MQEYTRERECCSRSKPIWDGGCYSPYRHLGHFPADYIQGRMATTAVKNDMAGFEHAVAAYQYGR